jgi:hypothetical protein
MPLGAEEKLAVKVLRVEAWWDVEDVRTEDEPPPLGTQPGLSEIRWPPDRCQRWVQWYAPFDHP